MLSLTPRHLVGLLISFVTFFAVVQSKFVNFAPGFEYKYKFDSNADVKNVGTFKIVAKVGYTNVKQTDEGQEVALRVYALDLKAKQDEGVPGHEWDFSNWFSFVITPQGQITQVYHPADDDDEAIAIKKGLAAMFASRLHYHGEVSSRPTGDGWQYNVNETGQEGQHTASYSVHPTPDGHVFTKVRGPKGHPVKHGTSQYTKTLYFDKDLGTIHTVEVDEKFVAMHKVHDGYDPFENSRPVKPVNEFTNVEYPEMSTLGKGKLAFLTRQKIHHPPYRPTQNLITASIHIDNVKPKKPKAVNIKEEMKHVYGNLTCMRNQPSKGSKEMTKCFTGILECLKVLPDTEIDKLAKKFLITRPRKAADLKDRNHIFDAVGALSSPHTQQLLLNLVLNASRPEAFLVKRLMIHIASMEGPPIDGIIHKLEQLVFNPELSPVELKDKDTYHRLVLAIGVVAKRLWSAGRREESTSITGRLENWLGLHDPWLYRHKRSLMSEAETIADDHWKVVLIESLGNAALDQSYDIIVSHVNTTNSQWVKRAGIHAMRKYEHVKAAHQMLKTALYDDDSKVRYEALLQYQAHPRAAALTAMYQRRAGNGSVFEDPYAVGTGAIAVHNRHRRSFLDEEFRFVLAAPGVHWKKVLGSTKIGASFGIDLENLLDVKISPLEGFAKINVYDEAYAVVHLGVLGFNLDFFRARLCFKGSAEYNLNLLQEFDIDSIKKLVELYDKIKNDVVDAIEVGIDLFKSIIDGDPSIGQMVDEFRKALEAIPDKIEELPQKAVKAMTQMGEIDEEQLPPFTHPTRNLIIKVTTLFKDVKSDVMTFYNTLMETITIIIPNAGDKIFKAIKTIVDGFKDFNSDPKGAISAIAGNVITVGMEVKNLVDAINKTKEACFFLKKDKPYWVDMRGQIKEIREMASNASKALLTGSKTWVNEVVKGKRDPIAEFTRGKTTMAEQKQKAIDMLMGIVSDLLAPLDGLKNLGGKFLLTYNKISNLVDSIKDAYDALREGYRTARSLIDRVFGPKCHKLFPRTIRQPGGGCDGSGNYPASLKNGQSEYKVEGVDISLGKGSMIVAPFPGEIMLSDNPNEVIIVASGGSLKNTKLFITNIQPNSTIEHPSNDLYVPRRVSAGQKIGEATTSPCGSNNHIHFAMQRPDGTVDPTRFLEPRVPEMPKWIQECDDYKLVWKFETVAAGTVVGLAGRDQNDTSPARTGESIDNPPAVNPSKDPSSIVNAANQKPDSFYQKQKSKKAEIDKKANSTKDSALKTLLKKPFAFMKKYSVRSMKLGALLSLMDTLGLDESMQKMSDIIKLIKEMIDNKPCFNPHQMTDAQLRTELTERGQIATGNRKKLIERITTPKNNCPALKLALPKNIYCSFDSMCLGIECCAYFKLGIFRKTFKVYARVDPCDFAFVIGVEKKFEKEFKLFDVDLAIDTSLKPGIKLDILGGIEFIVKLKLYKSEGAMLVTIGTGFCSQDDNENCIAFFNMMEDAITPLPICQADGTMKWPDIDYKSLLNKESFLKKLKESGKDIAKSAARIALAAILNEVPCIAETNAGSNEPCQRPEILTTDVLTSRLQTRNLPTTGTRQELVDRLKLADRTCTVTGTTKTLTLPQIKNEKAAKIIYLQVAPNCFRVDACLDAEFKAIEFNKAFRLFIELDMCRFTLFVGFETCTHEIILVDYKWGTPERMVLSPKLVLPFIIKRDEDKKVFLITLGAQFTFGDDGSPPIIDDTFLEDFEVPIPLCNEQFLPGNGSIKALAKKLGGKIGNAFVDIIFKKLGLDKVFIDGPCTVPDSPDCPWQLPDVRKYLPDKFKDKVTCSLPENCFGVQCCVDFVFDIPLFDKPLLKSTPFFLKFDPCNVTVELGFGTFYHKEVLLDYNWGDVIVQRIGAASDDGSAPVTISLAVDRYSQGFIVDLSITVCIPIDSDSFCFPEEGLKLLQQEKIPACDANALVEFSRKDFNMSNYLKEVGAEAGKAFAQSGARLLLDKFGISPFLLEERCDVTRPPYSPAVNGWKIDCEKNLEKLPKLPENLFCHIGSSCTFIECCFDIPILDMSFYGQLNIDMCDYFIHTEIENKTFTYSLFGDEVDLNKGISANVDIENVFIVEVQLRKEDKKFILDMDIQVCFEEGSCISKFPVLRGTKIPQLICDLSASFGNFKNFSVTDWAKTKGLQTLTRGAVSVILDQLGLKDKLLDIPCNRNGAPYQPHDDGNWKNDCPLVHNSTIHLPSLKNLPANCYLNDKCLGIECCLTSDVLGISLHAAFKIDLCEFYIEVSLEKFHFRFNILSYDWGKEEEVLLDGLPFVKLNFKIDRLLADQMFVVDLSVSLCFDGGDKCISLKVFDQTFLPMPGCAPIRGFKLPDFSLTDWLKDKGEEITAQVSALLMKELGVDKFLLDEQCQPYLFPFKDGVQGWKNDCPENVTLPSLPSNLHCYISDFCTGIICCAEIPQVRRNFRAQLIVNSCESYLSVGIENLVFNYPLITYEWGKKEEIDLEGLLRAEFSIEKLSGAKKFLVNLSLKLCLRAGKECEFKFPIFVDKLIPIPFCDWEATRNVNVKDLLGPAVLSDIVVKKLFSRLEITSFFLDNQCSMSSRGPNGWTSECPLNVSLPTLPESMACSIPKHCTAIYCCLHVPLINMNINFKLDLNMCSLGLTLGVEKLEYRRSLSHYDWGKPDSFSLKGIVRTGFVIDNLEAESQLLMSLNVSVCFDGDNCVISLPVVKEARIPNPLCDWTAIQSIRNVSISSVVTDLVPSSESLVEIARLKIAEALGIDRFLLPTMCDRKAGIYQNDGSGWNKACPLAMDRLPTLPDYVACHIPSYCTGIDCCMTVSRLKMSFNARLLLDACNFKLTVAIENLKFEISLFDFEWGAWKNMNLNRYVKLEYKVDNLADADMYLVSLTASLCFNDDDSCISFPVMTDRKLPKLLCNWDNTITIPSISLSTFLKENALQAGQKLVGVALSKFLDQTELAPYVKDPMCDRTAAPYAGAVNGWKKDCPAPISLPTLPSAASCVLEDPCGTVDCCIDVDFLGRSFHVKIGINPCTYTFVMGIEQLVFTINLLDYQWGQVEHLNLKKIVWLDFMVDDLFGEDKFLMNLNVSLCFDETCYISFPALRDVKIPKPLCDWKSTADLANVNFDTVLADLQATGMSQLTSAVSSLVLEKVNLGKYLKYPQCDISGSTYTPAVNGWKNDCPIDGLQSVLPNLPSNMKCYVSDICTSINCCVYVDYLVRSFNMFITVDMCTFELSLGIEDVVYKKMLFDYAWGTPDHFYIKSRLRIDYTIDRILAEKKLELSMSMSVCLEEGNCIFSKALFVKTKIPQPLCDWSGMLQARNFSLSQWSVGKGLPGDLQSFTNIVISQIMDDIGISQYLLDSSCNMNQAPYAAASQVTNWNKECTKMTVPNLPSKAKCHLPSSCDEVDCCATVPIINRNIQFGFSVDICALEMTMNVEKLTFKVSLMQYEWGATGDFLLGSLTRMAYKVQHDSVNKKLTLDLSIKFCFEKDQCLLEVPVYTGAELTYSPCNPSLPVPFKGVTFDFWKPAPCTLPAAPTGCSMSLPASVAEFCRLTDNCMGIICCSSVDLKYLGVYSLSTGIVADHCKNELVLHIENKEFTKSIPGLTSGQNNTEKIGDAVTVSYVMTKTPSAYELSLHVQICALNGYDLSETCFSIDILDKEVFVFPSSCSRRRRKRSLIEEIDSRDPRVVMRHALAKNVSQTELFSLFEELQQLEEADTSHNLQYNPDNDGAATNTKTALKEMGSTNPSTLLYSGEKLKGDVLVNMEGGEKIKQLLGTAKDIGGRVEQAFVPGAGLTGKGVELLGVKLANMTIGQIIAMFDTKNVDPELALQLVKSLRDLALALYQEILDAILNGNAEDAFKSFDLTLQGDFSFPRISVMFFEYQQFFLVGGIIPMTFGWGAGASYGVEIIVGAKVLGMKAFGSVVPYANAHVYGEIGIGAVLYGKLRIDGYIMTVSFPTTAEIGFSKFPLDISMRMDLQLTPIELVLRALVTLEIKIPFIGTIKKTLFSAKLWSYATPTISKRMVDIGKNEDDESPPQFINYVDRTEISVGRRKRQTATQQCSVRQLPDRDYTQPAVEIAVMAQDDKSQVELFVNVGTKPGLQDVLKEAQLGGPSTVITQKFHQYGIPIYFTVFGKNSGGKSSDVSCSIPTYDITLPSGRLTEAFMSSSNPSELLASVVVFEDSEVSLSSIGVGLGLGIYGDNIVKYSAFDLKSQSTKNYDAASDTFGHIALEHFTTLRDGRLGGPIVRKFSNFNHAGSCAKECMKYPPSKCLSFNYDFGKSGECELLEAIEGHDFKLSKSGQFAHYERVGVGMAYNFVERDLSLHHEAMYYFNLHLINTLGYENIISSKGIMLDLSPPAPGHVANVSVDYLETVDCLTLIPSNRPEWRDRCRGISATVQNHRLLHDGPGSMTVFNGDKPLQELRYTRANRYFSANWDGIHDYQTGVYGYSWTFGRQVCEELLPFVDPHAHLFDEAEWTHKGLRSPLPAEHDPLPDGKYYIKLRALNKVEYGGPLALTVCHTAPLGIDNTPPFVHEVYDVRYDEDTFVITARYNASDPESDIREADLCLGKTTRDCAHRAWERSGHEDGNITQVFEIPGGEPTWVKIRAINHVDLMAVGVANSPIVVDVTPPHAGDVYDGPVYKHDLNFTKHADKICSNWHGFYDEESGISEYHVYVQDGEGQNISESVTFGHQTFETCVDLPSDNLLKHGKSYFVVVHAFNGGHKQLSVQAKSNGVIVDLTSPVEGQVVDGIQDGFRDVEFSTHVATVALQWKDFSDPESGIREYEFEVMRAKNLSSEFEVLQDWKTVSASIKDFEGHNFHLQHRDFIKINFQAINNALGVTEKSTDGFVVDLTPPRMLYLGDGTTEASDAEFQFSLTTVEANFEFFDEESGIDHYKYQVYELYHGSNQQIYPVGGWSTLADPASKTLTQDGLTLKVGAIYSVRVGAVNRAGAVATYVTNGALLDNTAPDMKWVFVTIFAGSDEEVIDGYAIQSDNSGIKATWFATDHESGIKNYQVAVGTSSGGTDVLDWTDMGSEQDKYIDGLSLSITTPAGTPVYYVSVKATNGADLSSNVMTSHPIKVVEQDKPGIVIDGADATERENFIGIGEDIDYQTNAGTVTVQFGEFSSHEHGVIGFDWAVGTTPGGEEVQPFMMAGLTHEESETGVPGNGLASTGFGQAVLPLNAGTKYYTTVRGITNAGKVLESISDGFTVDQTPPAISVERFATLSEKAVLIPETMIYQSEIDSLAMSWKVEDSESPVKKMYYSVGTYPTGADVWNHTEVTVRVTGDGALPTGIKPSTKGKPNIVTLTVENEVGLTRRVISPSLVVDTTPPSGGTLTCPRFIQPLSAVECSWDGFLDNEGIIKEFLFSVGSEEGKEDVVAPVKLAGNVRKYTVQGLADNVKHGENYFAKVTAVNTVDMTASSISSAISVDTTPPVPGMVVELKSVYIINVTDDIKTEELNRYKCDTPDECTEIDAVCQESLTTVLVAWQAFQDTETDIVSYEIAVGNTPGGGQLRSFFKVPDVTKRHFSVTGLALMGEKQIFVTVKATNGAGLSSISSSNGIYMSYISQGLDPLSHIGVWDGNDPAGDVDYQTSLSSMSAMWDVSGDPCPITKYEWAIQRADGLVVQEYIDTDGRTFGVNDDLRFKNKQRFYQLLRVTNAMDFTMVLRSNGITIEENPLIPGEVNDGDVVGFDLEFLRTKTKISGNWDLFGSESDVRNLAGGIQAEDVVSQDNSGQSTSQTVAYYEVAVGTDRRYPKTRDNIQPFTNVGLNKTVTFYDLDLIPVTATYYFTVRAYSASGSQTEVSSNGFSVGFDGGVTAGSISMEMYINDNTQLNVAWDSFESKVGMMMYYIAVSNSTEAGEYKCGQFTERGSITDEGRKSVLNVIDIQNVGKDTVKKFDNISLEQNGVYYVWVIGADKAGECNMTSFRFQVDITPPVEGKIRTGPFYDMASSFAKSRRSVQAFWKNYSDPDSGLRSYHVSLIKLVSCSPGAAEEILVAPIELQATYSSYTFMNLDMERNVPYVVRITTENNAGLKVTSDAAPTLYDDSVPSAGLVIDGENFTKDLSWDGSRTTIKGTYLHHPVPDKSACPVRPIKFDDAGWKFMSSERNQDSSNRSLSLTYDTSKVKPDGNQLDIKITRETKKDAMVSGAYCRDADLVNGGVYTFSLRAAAGGKDVVTSVLFWDGEPDYFIDYDFTERPRFEDTNCECCYEDPVPVSCICDCKKYVEAKEFYKNRTKRATDDDTPAEGYQVVKLTDEQKNKLKNQSSTKDNSVIEEKLDPRDSCGVQIFAGPVSRIVSWCRFENSLNEASMDQKEVNKDLSASFHDYKITFLIQRAEARETFISWCMLLHMDGELISEQCGIPHLSPRTYLFFTVWNHKNYIPETIKDKDGKILVWSKEARFRDLVMPPEKDKLCRYGDPFYGGKNAITVYEAGIGSASGLADVVDFQSVYQPCIPCLNPCDSYNCDPACDQSMTTQVKIALNDLNLTETKRVNGVMEPVIYYLTVRAVLLSGSTAQSSSDGFYIDTSAPVFDLDVLLYFDVTKGEAQPAEFQASNDTIKIVWKCNDNESEVVNYDWSIGTSPGESDVIPVTSAGENAGAIKTGLTLEHNSTYYVTVTCTNGGGLSTTYSDTKGVTVLLEPPEVDDVNTTIPDAEPLGEKVYPPNSMKSTDQNSVSASWTITKDKSVDRYDFCVGSSLEKTDDIFPCVWIAIDTGGTVSIKDGYLMINDVVVRKLSEYRPDYNDTMNSTDSSALSVCPGTEMYINMKMYNKAGLFKYKLVGTVFIATDRSVISTSEDGSSMSMSISGVRSGGSGRKKRAADDITVTTPEGLVPGQSLAVTPLTTEDLQKEYKSVASTVFVPFITDPATTVGESAFLERVLRGRVNYSESDISFTITSVGNLKMPGPLIISYPYDPTDDVYYTMLMHWNPVEQKWMKSSRSCHAEVDTEVKNPSKSRITVKVCNTRLASPSTDDPFFSEPTQFLLASSLVAIPNSPPVLTSDPNVSLKEDEGSVIYQLTGEDPDGDVVRFRTDPSLPSPTGQDFTLSEEGLLVFTPQLDYYGTLKFPINLYEVDIGDILPATSTATITIEVTPENDAPVVFAFSNRESLVSADVTEPIEVLMEQNLDNNTEVVYKWVFGAYDVDTNENLTLDFTQSQFGQLSVGPPTKTAPNCAGNSSMVPCETMSLPHPSGKLQWAFYTFQYKPNKDFFGFDNFRIFMQDKDAVYSDVLTFNMTVMERPCKNGATCESKDTTQYTCNDYRRAIGFDQYYTCSCPAGWTGQHCTLEVNECASSPCVWPYVCYDDINKYHCACPESDPDCDGLEGWMIALIVLACILVLVISILAWYICMVRRGRLKWSWLCIKARGGSTEDQLKPLRGTPPKEFVNQAYEEGYMDDELGTPGIPIEGTQFIIYSSGAPDPTTPSFASGQKRAFRIPGNVSKSGSSSPALSRDFKIPRPSPIPTPRDSPSSNRSLGEIGSELPKGFKIPRPSPGVTPQGSARASPVPNGFEVLEREMTPVEFDGERRSSSPFLTDRRGSNQFLAERRGSAQMMEGRRGSNQLSPDDIRNGTPAQIKVQGITNPAMDPEPDYFK